MLLTLILNQVEVQSSQANNLRILGKEKHERKKKEEAEYLEV